jgi:hypothetical protein
MENLSKKISILIPHLPTAENEIFLEEAIWRYRWHTRVPFELCLFYNGGMEFPDPKCGFDIHWKRQVAPMKVASAWNEAFRMSSGDVVVWTNDDVVVLNDWAKPMLETLNQPRVGMVVPEIVTKLKTGGLEVIPHSHAGCFMMMKRETLDMLENHPWFPCFGMEEGFGYAYGEDDDMMIRLRICDLKVVKDRRAFVYHGHSTTLNTVLGGLDGMAKTSGETIILMNKKWTSLGYNFYDFQRDDS